MDVIYTPNEINENYSVCVWNEEMDEDFFHYIKNSEVYMGLKSEKIVKVDVYMDET